MSIRNFSISKLLYSSAANGSRKKSICLVVGPLIGGGGKLGKKSEKRMTTKLFGVWALTGPTIKKTFFCCFSKSTFIAYRKKIGLHTLKSHMSICKKSPANFYQSFFVRGRICFLYKTCKFN